ncbi:2-hydroxycarboxylate transporter family protein [Pokkaliibacter sp. MBI-7]|uniref:2-hydroxycarboxylate transporter family protein n=1 Tax=Pokkaliibacter sp. MBI-7 TaxID=3040600 RepID=UPI00244904C8|nr:2-hydroxycarboxylate transporter family protein [Pokkaliibacter sp. MBI-7]MDH2431379.1 2-hydroxycarboxylate transporter family protein [Pokkaliibacter sp. MBI-7]
MNALVSKLAPGRQVGGMPWIMFALMAACILFASIEGSLPAGMVGALALMFILGTALNTLGDRLPVVRTYLGGGAIVSIFGAAALFEYQLLPASSGKIISDFMQSGGFMGFYIASLVTGSVFGMSTDLLKKAALRYIPVIIASVAFALLFVGIAGMLMGYGFKAAVFLIGLPIMGGGMGAGAVPLVEIMSGPMQTSAADLMSKMVPALAMGNAIAIVTAGLLHRLGQRYPGLTGNGQLMRSATFAPADETESVKADPQFLGVGLFLSASMFVLGAVLSKFIPMHSYALMILCIALIKVLGLIPRRYELAAAHWFQFVVVNFTPALLVGIGVAYTNIDELISTFSLTYLVLVFVTVIGAVVGSALIGYLLGFHAIEASITAGLCMANMGGTGDVAVLATSRRMTLMPFAQISSRIGGAMMLVLATMLIQLFAGG